MTDRHSRSETGRDTRTLLIEVAERLFAERGFEAVTVADIRTAAGQRNASVVSYYFGSKENLLRAILDHRLPAVNARRDAMMRDKLAGEGGASARDALWCLVQPLADSLRDHNCYVALLDRLVEADLLGGAFVSADRAGSASAFAIDEVLYTAAGHAPKAVRRQRINMIYDSMLRTLARYNRAGTVPSNTELSGLIDAWEGMLRAPVSEVSGKGGGSVLH